MIKLVLALLLASSISWAGGHRDKTVRELKRPGSIICDDTENREQTEDFRSFSCGTS